MPNTMTPATLLSQLTAIWYLVDTEDEHKRPCVACYDVRPLIRSHLETKPMETLWEYLVDDAASVEVDCYVYDKDNNLNNAYQQAEKQVLRVPQLTAEVFAQSINGSLEFDFFNYASQQIYQALGRDPRSLEPRVWQQHHADGYSPLQTALLLL